MTDSKLELDSTIWDENVIKLIRSETRKKKFDFKKVSDSVKSYFVERNIIVDVNADICRRIFAGDFYSKVETNDNDCQVVNTNSVTSQDLKIESLTTDISEKENSSDKVLLTDSEDNQIRSLNSNDSLSYSEILDIIQKNENENMRKQENVFKRVLTSLRPQTNSITNMNADGISQGITSKSKELILIEEIQYKRKMEKELFYRKQQLMKKEDMERKKLEYERDQLRKRFEYDSVDNDGIDPFSDETSNCTFNIVV